MLKRRFKLKKWYSSLPDEWKDLKTPSGMDLIVELRGERNGFYYYSQPGKIYPLLERCDVEKNKKHWEEIKINPKFRDYA